MTAIAENGTYLPPDVASWFNTSTLVLLDEFKKTAVSGP
jgi:hypothetical protein